MVATNKFSTKHLVAEVPTPKLVSEVIIINLKFGEKLKLYHLEINSLWRKAIENVKVGFFITSQDLRNFLPKK